MVMAKFVKEDYEKHLTALQVELNAMHRWLQATGKRLVVVFEGRDTAGKGGAIEAISSCLNPRMCRVAALAKPSDKERTQWYFQRYVMHLPSAGEIVLFDRSWYNRAGVERVMGFCTETDVEHFFHDAPNFEKMLVQNDILFVKYWLSCDQEEQEKRFKDRLEDPLKRWKISPMDLAARDKYEDYTRAREDMFAHTHTKWAPWHVVDMNSQKRGRLNLIKHLLSKIPGADSKPENIVFPPLKRKLGVEKFKTKVSFVPTKF
jgi:polyphosphate kinase